MPGTEEQMQLFAYLFLAGVFIQAAIVSRDLKEIASFYGASLVAFIGMLIFNHVEEEGMTVFEVMMISMVIIYLLIPIFLYKKLLPAVEPLKILHYTALAGYVVLTLLDGDQAPI